jgi:hypothetical protein
MSTKIAGKTVQVFVDGYDLTGDHNRITLEDDRNTYDVTAFGDEARRFIVGPRNTRLTHEGYLNPADNRSHPALKDVSVGGAVTVLMGDAGLAYSFPVRQGRYHSRPRVGSYVPFTAAFATRGNLGGWGETLLSPDPFTDTVTGTVLDGGSASLLGGAVFLHLLTAPASDTYTFTVEGSATGAFGGEETVLATFVLNGATTGVEHIQIDGTVPRYVRARATPSGSAGDTVRAVMTLVRF